MDILFGFGLLSMAVAIFLGVLGILWFILPFAIFGTKDRLDRLIIATDRIQETLAETNHELRELRRQLTDRSP